MAEEDRTRDLPQRVRGEARGGSASSAPPVLSAELRQRIQAAVKAERDDTATSDQEDMATTEYVPTSGGAGRDAARPAIAGPAADDDITQGLGRAVVPEPGATSGAAGDLYARHRYHLGTTPP